MLILVLLIAAIVLIIAYLVIRVRRHDRASYVDRDRDPFHSESARLAAAGLLYEQEEREGGRPRKSYTITPAGEAALRTWLREPMNDPGMLRLYFAGIVAPEDVMSIVREQHERHEQRLEHYDRLLSTLPEKKKLEDARAYLELGQRFERFCAEFWKERIDSPERDLGLIPEGKGRSA